MTDEPYVSVVDRIPPQNLAAEMALLGAVLVDRTMLEIAESVLKAGDFYASLHDTIFVALQALYHTGRPLDKIALAEELRSRGMLEKIGGLSYLSSLMSSVPSAASTEYYAKVVREKASLRGLIAAGSRITQLGYESEDDVPAAIAEAELTLSRVVLEGESRRPLESSAVALDRIVAAMNANVREDVIFTPWPTINHLTGGFRSGELIALPAAPSVGKTTLALNFAEYVADRKGAVLMGSLEMNGDAVQRRRIAQLSDVSARAQRLGRLSDPERNRIYDAVEILRDRPLFVVGDDHNTLAALWRAARDVVRQTGRIYLIVIDQMGWIEDINREVRGTTRNDRKSAAFLNLIKMGREFCCPVVAVDHLNRSGMEGRPTFATLSKIRDGGNIEGHAHHVLFPYRRDPIEAPTEAEVIIAKTRDGSPGPVPMHYDGARALWLETDAEGHPQRPWFEMNQRIESRDEFDFQTSDDDLGDSPFSHTA